MIVIEPSRVIAAISDREQWRKLVFDYYHFIKWFLESHNAAKFTDITFVY